MNTLYYGDNFNILREEIEDESVDLLFIEPLFNSSRNYKVLFKHDFNSEQCSQILTVEKVLSGETRPAAEYPNIQAG